jgi:hypothetical protein
MAELAASLSKETLEMAFVPLTSGQHYRFRLLLYRVGKCLYS